MVRIYLDHAATTPMAPEVLAAMQPCLTYRFGNASSGHWFGREARAAVDEARDSIALVLGASHEEIYFTSGGTESDNLAILGAAYSNSGKGNHIITAQSEHHAVLETCAYLQAEGFEVTYLPVDGFGLVDPEDVGAAITNKSILISIMYANNEIGTILPIADIGRIAHEHGVLFHTDAVQAFGSIPTHVEELQVDLVSITAHKIYGPKGIGALYVRAGTKIRPLMYGGSQERERRPGTHNVPGIVGLAAASGLAHRLMPEAPDRMSEMRDNLISRIMSRIPDVSLNGHPTNRLPNNANLSFAGVEGETLLLNLDLEGIAASSGSACTAGSVEPSHVLKAIGVPAELQRGALRLTLGRGTSTDDITYTIDALERMITRLRS